MFRRARRMTLARATGVKPYVSPGARLRRKVMILALPVVGVMGVVLALGDPQGCAGAPCEGASQDPGLVTASILLPPSVLAPPSAAPARAPALGPAPGPDAAPHRVSPALAAARRARATRAAPTAHPPRDRSAGLFLTDTLATR